MQRFPTFFCSRTPKQGNKNWRTTLRFLISIKNNKPIKLRLKNYLCGVLIKNDNSN